MADESYRNDLRLACVQIFLSTYLGFYFFFVTMINQLDLFWRFLLPVVAFVLAFMTTFAFFLSFRSWRVSYGV